MCATNGPAKSTNSLAKWAKRAAFGARSFVNCRVRALLRAGRSNCHYSPTSPVSPLKREEGIERGELSDGPNGRSQTIYIRAVVVYEIVKVLLCQLQSRMSEANLLVAIEAS